ncbi:MAG TPA: MBG domain-containing protein, partial [Eubacteriales bacterium]|nr:MBG domain-containing protein [Eubacteriales bacterium]
GNYNNAFGHADVTITKVALTVTADDRSMTYGDTDATPAEGVSYSGFVNGESSSVVGNTSSITYTYKDASDNTVTVGSTLAAGAYSIMPGVSGLTATNYTFTPANGTLTVDKAAMTVGSAGYDELYDGAAHGLTASVPGVPGAEITYSTSEDGTYTTTCPTFTNAGEYTVYFKAVDPDGNHTDASGSAKVIIRKVEVTVTADDRSMTYGEADATPAEGVSYNGFVNSETDGVVNGAGSITYTYKDASDNTVTVDGTLAAGAYSITPDVSGLTATNYTFVAADGELTVNPRPVMIVANAAEKNFGTLDPAFTYHFETGEIGGTTYYGILAADAAAFTLGVNRTDIPDETVGVHTDALTPVFNADAATLANYAVTPVSADFTINPEVVYLVNTADAVTGFPANEWFDYLSDATVADATGVERTGYVLAGWTDLLSGTDIALGETIPAIDQTYFLVANWEFATYDVTYETGTAAAVGNMPADQTDIAYTTVFGVSALTPTRAGYTFAHWTTTDITGAATNFDEGETFEMPANAVVLTAVWTPNISAVSYHANGGEGGAYQEGLYATDTVVTVAGNTFTRPGYRFTGWSTTANGAVAQQPGNTFVMGGAAVDFYAQWQQEFYTVTYIVTGGTGEGLDGETPYATYTNLAYGDAMPTPDDPASDGYTFDGWTTEIPATVPEGGITIYGSMSEIVQPVEPPEVIPEDETPLAGASWALLNLILAIATALASVLMLIGLASRKKKEELEGGIVRETNKRKAVRFSTLLPAVGGIVAFILTENMKNPMAFVDRWTILMAVIAVIQLALVFFGIKRDKDVDPNAEK